MNTIGSWLRQLSTRMAVSLRRFMEGRYGNDKLNNAILGTALLISILGLFIRTPLLNLIAYVLMFWAIFRTLSRNTYKRYQENRKFLMLVDRLKDRKHKYFQCPRCHQPVRVPRGKGKISITCPKCKEKFVKKT